MVYGTKKKRKLYKSSSKYLSILISKVPVIGSTYVLISITSIAN